MKSDRSPSLDPLAATAARWVEQRDAGLSPAQQAELRDWLAADRRHAEAFAAADAAWSELNWPLHSGTTDRVLAGLQAKAARRRAQRRRISAVAALAVLLLGGALISRQSIAPRPLPSSFVVQVPHQKTLPDGSIVELPPGVTVETAFTPTERRVILANGTAYFQVRKDPARPFLVSSGSVVTRAVGTAFVVAMDSDQVTVIVTEGTVAIDHHATPSAPERATHTLALVGKGESVAITSTPNQAQTPQVEPITVSTTDKRLAWRTPRLEFQNTPLREVVEAINRYTPTPLVFADDNLQQLRISGTLRADRVDALLEMLQQDFNVSTIVGETEIVLRPGTR